MKSDQAAASSEEPSNMQKGAKGPLTAPPAPPTLLAALNKHKRAGSTGTTGDESCTTDEEDNAEQDEPDCSIKDHVTSKLFGSFSDVDSEKAMYRFVHNVCMIEIKMRPVVGR